MAGGDAMNHDALTIKSKLTNYVSEFYNSKITNQACAYIEPFHQDYNENLTGGFHLNLATLDSNRSQESSSLSVSSKTGSSRHIHYINSAIFIERYDSDTNLCYNFGPDGGTRAEKSTFRKETNIRDHNMNNRHQCSQNRVQSDERATTKSSTTSDISTDESAKRMRNLTFEGWLAQKQQLKQKQVKNVINTKDKQKQEEMAKQRRLEEQREDFKRWLALKKEQEIQRKREAELKALKAKQEEELRAQKMAEKENMLKVWIRKKAEEAKEKKRREEEKLRQIEEFKRERKERSEKAFEQWVRRSKYHPRPVPLNMGLESLKGSVSAMFVNPTPWQENIDVREPSSA